MQKVAKQSLWPEVILESKLIDKDTFIVTSYPLSFSRVSKQA